MLLKDMPARQRYIHPGSFQSGHLRATGAKVLSARGGGRKNLSGLEKKPKKKRCWAVFLKKIGQNLYQKNSSSPAQSARIFCFQGGGLGSDEGGRRVGWTGPPPYRRSDPRSPPHAQNQCSLTGAKVPSRARGVCRAVREGLVRGVGGPGVGLDRADTGLPPFEVKKPPKRTFF